MTYIPCAPSTSVLVISLFNGGEASKSPQAIFDSTVSLIKELMSSDILSVETRIRGCLFPIAFAISLFSRLNNAILSNGESDSSKRLRNCKNNLRSGLLHSSKPSINMYTFVKYCKASKSIVNKSVSVAVLADDL